MVVFTDDPFIILRQVSLINPAIKEIAESAGDFLEWRYE
jgi:hypothetical protein